jgi:hypothetical protein
MHFGSRAVGLLVSAVFALLMASACAPGAVGPTPGTTRNNDAILILPGFGYSSTGRRAFERFADKMRSEGFDVYVADYVQRDGLEASGAAILDFVKTERLDQYPGLHIFAFIAGAWSLNPLLQKTSLPNLKSLVYDRSPLQERAPRIAAEELTLPARILFGEVIFEIARTPYTAVTPDGARIGLLIETRPTQLLVRYKDVALSYGPISAAPESFRQPFHDLVYLPYDHDSLYARYDELTPLLLSFFRTGYFSANALRVAPADLWQPADE